MPGELGDCPVTVGVRCPQIAGRVAAGGRVHDFCSLRGEIINRRHGTWLGAHQEAGAPLALATLCIGVRLAIGL